ncbi:MAG: YbjN domain-containing protein [Chroococcidiopsidaceae cyanobacterium CP_BM_ER_R8_30]|nr:YbjN domain-containing protein [Chroococcidiopsidaceae cyanobacterium CP_BM_ER_R8_30]
MTANTPDPETVVTQSLSSRELIDKLVDDTNIDYVEVIQTVIASLQQDESAMVSKTAEGHIWKFKYGSVEVFVQLTGVNDEDTFTAWAAVLKLPAKDEPRLMRHLLEMNWSGTFESCFGIYDDQVVVLSTNILADLTPGEISRIITVVATIADENDEALQAEFGNN